MHNKKLLEMFKSPSFFVDCDMITAFWDCAVLLPPKHAGHASIIAVTCITFVEVGP